MNIRVILAILAAALLIAIATYTFSIKKPDSISLILKTGDKDVEISDILKQSSTKIGMTLKKEDFKFGGDSSIMKSYLMYDSEISVMIQSMSEEECRQREGRRDPIFSKTTFTVSIYRTSIFRPKRSLQDVARILKEEVRRQGGSLVTEDQKCGAPASGAEPRAETVAQFQ